MPSAPIRRPTPGQLVRSWVSLVDFVMVAPHCSVAACAWEAGAASAPATSAAATIGVSFMGRVLSGSQVVERGTAARAIASACVIDGSLEHVAHVAGANRVGLVQQPDLRCVLWSGRSITSAT